MSSDDHAPGRVAGELTEDERAELSWLRAENRLLRAERDILLRVATGYTLDARGEHCC